MSSVHSVQNDREVDREAYPVRSLTVPTSGDLIALQDRLPVDLEHPAEDVLRWVFGNPPIGNQMVRYHSPSLASLLMALQLIPDDYQYQYDVYREDYPDIANPFPHVQPYVPDPIGDEPGAGVRLHRRNAIVPPVEHDVSSFSPSSCTLTHALC